MQSRPITNLDYNKVEQQDVGLFYNMQLCNNNHNDLCIPQAFPIFFFSLIDLFHCFLI